VAGSLACHKQGLWADLLAQGYTPLSSRNLLYLTAHLSRWLDERGLRAIDLSEDRIEEFLDRRRGVGYTHHLTRCALKPVLEHLRRAGALPVWEVPVAEPTPLDQLLHGYEGYLAQERALVPATVQRYREAARKFLSGRFEDGSLQIGRMNPAEISSFILGESRRWSIGTAKYSVTALRSLLRYLLLRGEIAVDLASAVPAVAGYRLSGLPKTLTEGEVERLLQGCDRSTSIGLRDFAVLLLMSRLGLRACEVVRLDLDDVQWARGEMMVRGKGGREDNLPLPWDVGKAMADYLRQARPSTTCRALFVTATAPHRKLTSHGIQAIVQRAGRRIGLASLGSHRLRHTAATRMLGRGASLPEIAQVLGHRSLETTAIYAKVDRDALRPLCRPWLGGRP
jgi:site-specific recombinase XerD